MSLGILKRFTNWEVLNGIGKNLLVAFLASFTADLAAKRLSLPDSSPPARVLFQRCRRPVHLSRTPAVIARRGPLPPLKKCHARSLSAEFKLPWPIWIPPLHHSLSSIASAAEDQTPSLHFRPVPNTLQFTSGSPCWHCSRNWKPLPWSLFILPGKMPLQSMTSRVSKWLSFAKLISSGKMCSSRSP